MNIPEDRKKELVKLAQIRLNELTECWYWEGMCEWFDEVGNIGEEEEDFLRENISWTIKAGEVSSE